MAPNIQGILQVRFGYEILTRLVGPCGTTKSQTVINLAKPNGQILKQCRG